MIECTVDTHVLADLLRQYSASNPNLPLKESEFLTQEILKRINTCIVSSGFDGVIVASSFAFLEIINRFSFISNGDFDIVKIVGFINQPPEWFIIEPYSIETVKNLIKIPKFLTQSLRVGLEDAIHVATAMQRGPDTYLATHDSVLAKLNYVNLKLIHLK